MVKETSRHEAKIHARRGEAALQRYITGPPASQDTEYAAAVQDLTLALRCLAADDPMRADVCFNLGVLRLAAHDKRCGELCQATGEFAPIVELIAAGGARAGAPARQLSLYAIVADKLYDHTHDPADIDIAIDWLRRAARDRRLTEADRRRMLICIAVQHTNRGDATRVRQGRSGPGTDSWAAFDAAISQFDEVLARVDRRGSGRDGACATDRLDAWLGQLETYYQRGGDAARDEDLGIMAALARNLITEMAPGYHVRPYALGRAGTALIQRLTRLLGDPWDRALNSMVLSMRPDAMTETVSRVPDCRADLELAIGSLTQAVRLADPADRRHPVYTAALFSAHCLRYLAFLGDDDIRETIRLGRAVMGHPQADPGYRRQCGEWVLLVLARHVAGTEASAGAEPRAGWMKLSPSADGDLDTMLGLLAAFAAEDGATLAPALSAFLTDSVLTRAEGDLSNAELSAEYARARKAAADVVGVPTAHAVLILRAAEIGAQLIYRGVAPAVMADEVAAAFSAARLGLPAGHPLARKIAARAAAFESARRKPPGAGTAPTRPAGPTRAAGPARQATAEELPPVLDVFSVRALAALGVGTQGWLAETAGSTTEAVTALLASQLHDAARRAAVLSVLALAKYATWLRERTGDGLGGSLDHMRTAIAELPAGHPLRSRLTLVLARMLLDRAQLGGDLADVDTALTLLDGLRALADIRPAPVSLGELLALAGPPQLSEQLAAPPTGQLPPAGEAEFRLDLDAAVGSGKLLRGILAGRLTGPLDTRSPDSNGGGRTDEDLGDAIATLRRVAGSLPVSDPRRPDVLSDLGLALLASGPRSTGPRQAGAELGDDERDGRQAAAVKVLREAAATATASPGGHPRAAAILLRAAAALAVAERDAAGAARREHSGLGAGCDPPVLDEGIGLLTQALSSAGLAASGERSRCLYGLGSILLIRFTRTRLAADLADAITRLEEARAGVEAVPGDPFLVPLLRALAWAHRQNAYRLAHEDRQPARHGPARADTPRLPLHRSRSTGRSLLYAHAQSVLLQSGSRHALAASRVIGRDALTLAEWCIADGRAESAVDALELGRALVLHSATVAADVPALLREAGQPELAAEWDDQASATHDAAGDVDAIPGDLRGRVLAALRTGAADWRLLAAPSVADIASALRAAGLDALAYLIPALGAVRGRAVTVGADGMVRECLLPNLAAGPGTPLAQFASADYEFRATRLPATNPPDVAAAQRFRQELDGICDWAWTAAIGPLLDQFATAGRDAAQPRPLRLAIVPIGPLGLVPWHAARRDEAGQVRYACADVIFTTCASARQLIEAVGRPRLAPGAGPAVFVANPGGDLPGSQLEADAICAAFYSGAVCLGQSARTQVSGAGSPDEVLACLPGHGPGAVRPAVLHLGCHASAGASPDESRLALAGGSVLPVSRILGQAHRRDRDASGGLVVLAACTSDLTLADYDEALTLASAFLAAGMAGAVGARWAVNDRFTVLLMFMFHRHLVRYPGDGPAGALRAAQLWMLDPRRELPPEMPGEFAVLVRRSACHPYAWAAFTYHGQ